MSLRGYIKKSKPALWTQTPDQQEMERNRAAEESKAKEAARQEKLRTTVEAMRTKARQLKERTFTGDGTLTVNGKVFTGKVRFGVAPMSARRKKEARQYSKLRAEFLATHPTCQRPGCDHASTDVHHKNGRGKNYLRTETWLATCAGCHDWIHQNMAEARKLGLIAEMGEWM